MQIKFPLPNAGMIASAGLMAVAVASCGDDHANRTIGAYEGSIHQTPNIDRLAEEGAVLTRSYCSNPICGGSPDEGQLPAIAPAGGPRSFQQHLL